MKKIKIANLKGATTDWTVIYGSELAEQIAVDPTLELAINDAGSLNFTVYDSDFAKNIISFHSYISVLDDDEEEIFYGRVASVSDSVVTGITEVSCIGCWGFLTDGEIHPDVKGQTYDKTVAGIIRRCITDYNSDIGTDSYRNITVGTIQHSKSGETISGTISSYSDVKGMLAKIVQSYDGFFILKRNQSGSLILDYYEDYGEANPNAIQLSENIIEQNTSMNGNNYFTVIRPTGKNGITLTEKTLDVVENPSVRIVKSVGFSEASTEAALRTEAQAMISRIQSVNMTEFTVGLVDMHYLDGSIPKLKLFDKISVQTSNSKTKIVNSGSNGTLIVCSVSKDFNNPQNDSVTIKDPKIDSAYSSNGALGGSGSSSGGSLSGGYGSMYKYITETDKTLTLHTDNINLNAERITMNSNELISVNNKANTHSTYITTLQGKVQVIEGTELYQNADHIATVVGKFGIDDKGEVFLCDGSVIDQSGNAVNIMVGSRIQAVETTTDTHTLFLNSFQGTDLYQNRDSISAVAGQFHFETTNGVKRLVLDEGGGFKIKKDNVEYGIYSEDNLTAGVIVNKINGGTVSISGSKISIGNSDATTVINGKLDASAFTADSVAAHLASLDKVSVKSLDVGGALRVVGDQSSPKQIEFGDYTIFKATSIQIKDKNGLYQNASKAFVSVSADKTTDKTDEDAVTLTFTTLYGGTEEVTFKKPSSNFTLGAERVSSDDNLTTSSFKAKAYKGENEIEGKLIDFAMSSYTHATSKEHLVKVDATWTGHTNNMVGLLSVEDVYTDGKTQGTSIGKAAATISGSWSNGTYTATNDFNSDKKASTTIFKGTVSWDSNKATVPINYGSAQYPSSTGYSVEVDASGIYETGRTDGWAGCKSSVELQPSKETALGYSGSVTVYAKGYATKSATAKSNFASVKITAPADRYSTGYNAGKTDGWNGCANTIGLNQGSTDLDYGESITINPTYTNSLGAVATGTGITITAPEAGGSASASQISLSSFNWVDSSSSWSTSGKTKLSTLSSLIASHKNGKGYIYFKASITGGTGTKTYYISIG